MESIKIMLKADSREFFAGFISNCSSGLQQYISPYRCRIYNSFIAGKCKGGLQGSFYQNSGCGTADCFNGSGCTVVSDEERRNNALYIFQVLKNWNWYGFRSLQSSN